MSNEEQAATIGRAVQEYGEVKKKFAALTLKANALHEQLFVCARFFIAGGVGHGVANVFRGHDRPDELDRFPTQVEVAALEADIRETQTRKQALSEQLKAAGVELKD